MALKSTNKCLPKAYLHDTICCIRLSLSRMTTRLITGATFLLIRQWRNFKGVDKIQTRTGRLPDSRTGGLAYADSLKAK